MSEREASERHLLSAARREILAQLDGWMEMPMLVLGVVWLLLMLYEFVYGRHPLLEAVGVVIWIIFILDFALKFLLAPVKLAYLKHEWLTAVALLLPALRVFRVVRLFGLLGVTRAARGLRLVRVVTSVNGGMKALGATMSRRGFGYVVAVSILVTLAGAAGMYAFENEVPNGLHTYGAALWWTAMLLTSLGSEYWPQTPEGRVLCFLLALYGFAVFGYLTATLATFFIGRDAEDEEAELAGAKAVAELKAEIMALREEVRALRQ